VQREGREPEGLKIIRHGNCAVCTEKLTMRRVDKQLQNNHDLDLTTQEHEELWQSNHEELREVSKNRVFQNKLEVVDDTGKLIQKDTLIYKDLLTFNTIGTGKYFGGRSLLAV
jgi:hypothetical protein